MNKIKRFISIKTKIIISTLVPIIVSFIVIISVTFTQLFNAFQDTAKAEFLSLTEKYAAGFESKINDAMNYLSIIVSNLELQAKTDLTDRKKMQEKAFYIFDNYKLIDGSSIYFEPNMYDGRDTEYIGSQYGTALSGRICYYFYKDGEKTAYLPEAMENEIEFELPHYTEAKKNNKSIYSEPVVYEVGGRQIPMFTLTHPIRDVDGVFIGAATVDVFLEDLHKQLQNEKIYETGYVLIVNDMEQIIYSPKFEDIGKKYEESGIDFSLSPKKNTSAFLNAKSMLNGKDSLVAVETVYIPQLDRYFYISVTTPMTEINAGGVRSVSALAALCITIIIIIALLLYYLTGRIMSPIRELTDSVDKIAKGDYNTRLEGNYKDEFAIVKSSVNSMADSIEEYIKESKNSLKVLESIFNGLDAFIYVTVPETGEILFINERMKNHFNIKDDGVGQLCYKVLQEGFDEKCSFCPCYQLDKEPDKTVVWEEHNTVTNRDYRNTDSYIEWLGGTKVHLQHSVDITDLKKYMNDKLNAEYEALDLKNKKERAEETSRMKSEFLANMSHEIRTPMNAVMGMTELILRKELPQDVYENALVIKSASANLLSIINDILDFSKIESGMLEIKEDDYLFPSLINDIINIIRIRLIDKPIQFAVNIDSRVPFSLVGDELRIRQVLTNLLSNAIKYTPKGHILFKVTGDIKEDDVILKIEVEDTGIGVKPEDMEKLFGDFVQVDTAANKGIEGTGLGLAISRNLCKLMGGDIALRSIYGTGSTFTVTLPQKIRKYEPFASIGESNAKTILIYETREFYRDSVIWTFETLGASYKVVDNIPALFDNLDKYDYVFVSSFMYGSVNPTLSKFENPPRLVLLADVTETIAPKDARLLALPAHSLSVANILNDIYEDYGGAAVTGVSFIAPEAKILIVDDVMANLKVAEGLLLPYEMQVTLCSGGREALGLVEEISFDLVFMDHMMPEMDGIETTRNIRAMEGEYFKSLPIIALTANAVSGVREMFIQNGMNDFLAKPIETAKLNIILEKWISSEKRKKKKYSAQPEEESEFIDLLRTVPELSVDKALSVLGGSAKTYEKIVKLSVRLLPENIERLNNLIDSDLQNYMIEVHGIKGVLNNIGAYELGKKAFELEKLSAGGNRDVCKMLHPDFIDKLILFENLMRDFCNKKSASEKAKGDILFLNDILFKLDEKIEFFDSVGALELLSSAENQTFGQKIDEMIEKITHAFERFNFDEAEEEIKKLKGELGINE